MDPLLKSCSVELFGYFFLKISKISNSLGKFFVFENLLFRKSYFSKRDFFDLPPHTLDPVAPSIGVSEFPSCQDF